MHARACVHVYVFMCMFHVHVSCVCFMCMFHVYVSCVCFMCMFHVYVSCVCFMCMSYVRICRDIPYLLNGVPEHRIIVMANVVNPDLHLLPDPLHPFGGQNVRLYQTPGGAAGQGPSSSVALINKGNAVVPFSWSAKNDADALYWSIQPSIGKLSVASNPVFLCSYSLSAACRATRTIIVTVPLG